MTDSEITLPTSLKPSQLPRLIERAAAAEGLKQTLKGTLAKYPGCTHWHYKKGQERGTLEITWWPLEKKLWAKVADNRQGKWLSESIARLKQHIETSKS